MLAAKAFEGHLRGDLFRLFLAASAGVALAWLFLGSPVLATPTGIAWVFTLLLTPPLSFLERQGRSRKSSILILFGIIGVLLLLAGATFYQIIIEEWESIQREAPLYFSQAIEKLTAFESKIASRFRFVGRGRVSAWVNSTSRETASWLFTHGTSLAGDLLTNLILVPILTYFFLSDGPLLKKRFFQLIPNRYFESTYSVTTKISNSISDYLRAKLIEATLVGSMVMLGLALIGAPYSVLLGILAGVTNIVPYVGPFFGLGPALIVVGTDPAQASLFVPVLVVYGVANAIDNIYIFPVVVAKLVDLHPLLLIAAVTLGQEYYGLVGMLISIPLASAAKVMITEIAASLYPRRRRSRVSGP